MISCKPVCHDIATEYGMDDASLVSNLTNEKSSLFNPHFVKNVFTDELLPGSIHQWDRPCACPLLSCYPYHDPVATGMISEVPL